jgi:Rrf2 family protein
VPSNALQQYGGPASLLVVASASVAHSLRLKLSVKSDYAVRAVLALARRFVTGEATRIDVIAAENGIPPNYLVQILIELKSGTIVKSQRGKEGGYLLARPPANITFGDVLHAIHGPLFDSPAFTDPTCPSELRACWQRLREVVESEGAKINFQKILEETNDRERMFYI